MFERTAKRGLIQHPDPDVLSALYYGCYEYSSLEEAEQAVADGELSELELEAVEEGLIERGEL